MRGFVLASGFGTRLRPITDHYPKALVPVGGRPLLEHALAFLARQGVHEIGVNAHHHADQIAAFRKSSHHPFSLFIERDSIRGTGGGLYEARDFLSGDDTFLACNADIILHGDLGPAIAAFEKSDWIGCLLAAPPAAKGSIHFDPETRAYRGVPADGSSAKEFPATDFIGAAIYRREFLDLLRPDDFSIVPVWRRAMEIGMGVLELDRCYWKDAGTPASLAGVHRDILDGTCTISCADDLVVDTASHRCWRKGLDDRLLDKIGPYGWVETKHMPPGCSIDHSVVYREAVLSAGRISRRIVTAFGEVAFDE